MAIGALERLLAAIDPSLIEEEMDLPVEEEDEGYDYNPIPELGGGLTTPSGLSSQVDPLYGALYAASDAVSPGGGGGGRGGRGGGGGGPMGPGYHASPEQARRMARRMAAQRGWTGPDWRRLRWIVEGHGSTPGESNWDIFADNPTSSAIGIPQRLQSVHGRAGRFWRNNARPQIDWLLDYIQNRYGGPRQAWAFKSRKNWY